MDATHSTTIQDSLAKSSDDKHVRIIHGRYGTIPHQPEPSVTDSGIIPDRSSGADVQSSAMMFEDCSSLNSVNIPRLNVITQVSSDTPR